MGAPLTVGYGEGENYLGSDALAVAPWTQRIAYLDEGDWAVVRRDGIEIFDRDNRPVEREIVESGASSAPVEKGNYAHYMQKEIFEQPIVVAQTLQSYVRPFEGEVALPVADADLAAVNRLTIVACGTSYYAGLVAKYWVEQFARVPVDIDVASEFRYRQPVLEPGGLALFISQSGETADTLAALRHARAEQQRIAVVVNVPTSSMAREADLLLPTHAGPEIGVASTKAFTCQLAVLAALAANLARAKGRLSREEESEIVAHLQEAPAALNAALDHDDDIAAMAHLIAPARDVLYLGRGPDYPMALEGALKLKEISYIHAEGYAAGEMKHGPDRADRRRCAGDRARAVRAAVREDRQQHAGGARARRQDRADQRRQGHRRGGRGVHGDDRDARGPPADRAAGLCGAGAAAGLSRGGAQRHRRRPAAQPGEERDGRVSDAPASEPLIYNRDDFVALARQIRQERMQLYSHIAIGLVGLMIVTFGLNWLIGLALPWWQVGLGLIAAALLWALASPQVQGLLIRYSAHRMRNLDPLSFAVVAEGFEARSDRGHSLVKWSAVHSIAVDDARLFVLILRDSAYIVPRRAFAADADFDAFVRATRECWKMHHRL